MTKQMTPLRQRMIEDMTIRNMSPSTQKIYVAAVANFSIFHGRLPTSSLSRTCATIDFTSFLGGSSQTRSTRLWVRCASSTARHWG